MAHVVVVVLGVLMLAFAVLLVAGAISGRVKATSCCAVADPKRDLRMRAAFVDSDEG